VRCRCHPEPWVQLEKIFSCLIAIRVKCTYVTVVTTCDDLWKRISHWHVEEEFLLCICSKYYLPVRLRRSSISTFHPHLWPVPLRSGLRKTFSLRFQCSTSLHLVELCRPGSVKCVRKRVEYFVRYNLVWDFQMQELNRGDIYQSFVQGTIHVLKHVYVCF